MPTIAHDELIAQYPALKSWTTPAGERVEFIPFDQSIEQEIITHSYTIPFIAQNTCVIPKRGNGKWWIAGGTTEVGETWRETLARELMEELGATLNFVQPFGAYRTTGAEVTYRVVSWAEVELLNEPSDPDGERGIVEFKLIDPQDAPPHYESDIAHLGAQYLLADQLRNMQSEDNKSHV